jgi:RecB family exonuclease
VKRFSENAERTSVCVARASVQDEVAAFSGALFVGGSPLRPSGAIAFGEAAGEDGENALVAREVMALVAAGVRPEEVAVVFRHAGSRMASLVSTLQSTGVPVAADVSEAFKRTSFGGALLGLMGACSHAGAEREQLLAFLHSPYSGCTHEVAGRVDGLLRRRGVEASRMVHVASAELDVAGRRILTDARALMAMTVGEESISKWQHLTGRLFANAWTGEALKSRGAALDAAAHSRFLEAVSELAFADGGATATDLLRSLRSVRVSAGASSEFTGVLVTEAHRLRGRTVRALVIGGLSVDEFSSEGHESLAASMGESLGQPAGPDQGLFERMLFHELVSRATEHLILIRRYVDEDGAALRPSAFWDEALDVYRSRDEALEGVLPAGLRLARIDTGEALELSSGSGARRALLRAHPAKSAPVETRRGEADDRLREEMATREEFSVSELEVYLSCPYRWFFERALRSRSLDVTFEARERGSLAHELVAAFYREWSSRELGRVTAASMDEALVVFEGVKEHILARAGRPGPRDLREEMGVARAVRWARSIIEKDAEWLPGFEPLHHEFGFGAEPQDAFGFAGVRLRGSIDRVDVSGRGIVVTDYKSTSEIKGVASFATYGLIQLPVYAAAAARILELPILAGLYRSFNSGGARGFWVSGNDILVQGGSASDSVEDVEGVLAGAVAMVEEAVAGIRAADITPRPRGAGVCAFCGARPVCPEVR